jgi:hypothetical protein
MKRFLAIYIGTEAALERSGWKKLDEETRKAREASGIKAWMDFPGDSVEIMECLPLPG